MTAPRYVVPNKVYLLTRRTLERRYFLRPDARTNAILLYLVAVAAARYGIGIIAFVFMSSHYLCSAEHKMCYAQRGVMWS